MTATRIARLATIAVLVVLWAIAAALLWRTRVPADLELPRVRARDLLGHAELARRDRHARFLRIADVLALAAQLAALALLAARAPSARGRALVRAAQLGALVGAIVVAIALPFRLAELWWQRRAGIALVGYGAWLVDQLRPLAFAVVLGAVGGALVVALARALGRRWWIAGWPALAALGGAVVLAQPLLTPRLEPLGRPAFARDVARLAEREGLAAPRIEVRRAAKRTRVMNAEALGVGPTTRLIVWDTALRLRPPPLRVLAAHELAHVARRHLWKGLAWFALLALPGVVVVARVTRLDVPDQVPRAALVAALLTVAATPFANVLSRRYEAEADWIALQATRDPAAARTLLLALSASSLGDPDPPVWSRQLLGTHPSLEERIAMTRAWEARR